MTHQLENTAFYSFLVSNFEKGEFTNDDAVAIVLPLLNSVASIHGMGMVSTLDDLSTIIIENEKLTISTSEKFARNNLTQISTFLKSKSDAFVIREEYSQKFEIGEKNINEYIDDSIITDENTPILKPAYLKNYACYELRFDHHDPLTDIFILGMILASISLNLDFSREDDLKHFVSNRKSMIFINAKIHPAIANIIAGMTELDRSLRWKDLNEVIEKLKNYRDYNPENEYDLAQIITEKKSNKNKFILEKLRNRLFDNSRRNRLLFYKPNLKFLNLTVSSIPQVLNYNNIDPNSLFYWNKEISKKIISNSSISLNKYIRFEDNPYISPTLDKIRLEANKDINEYGFSQLKLVLCFLNWYNTKENAQEKIQSPLLLASINLTKKKGLKDQFTVDFLDDEVEINPVLANTLKELYDIRLPETIQLSETSIDDIYLLIKSQVEKNSSGITLENIDKPRIKLIHTQAKNTLSQYNKRIGKRKAIVDVKHIPYSYSQEEFQPYGLELYKQYVDSGVSNLEFLIDATISLSPNRFNENKTVEREFYTVDDGETNPFKWEFDTCNMVMGNFNYKKMSLVRDYNLIIDNQIQNPTFNNLFNELAQKEFKHSPSTIHSYTKTYNVVASDPTQNNAVLLSELGENYIIQGPPGTGKSQTIANLIANFVANGKKILFVCEKRTALDVVYYRLKNQGLDQLCCLIHDSQTDKKEFILNLKSSFNEFSSSKHRFDTVFNQRNSLLNTLENEINVLEEFHQFMKSTIQRSSISIKSLFDVLIGNPAQVDDLHLQLLDLEADYTQWENYKNPLNSINTINTESNSDPYLSNHPFKYFRKDIFAVNESIASLAQQLQSINELISDLQEELDILSLPVNSNSNFNEILSFLETADLAMPLFENNTEFILTDKQKTLQLLTKELAEINSLEKQLSELNEHYPHWSEKLNQTDTKNALAIIEKHEGKFFNFLNGNYRKTKKQVLSSYRIAHHKIKPKLTAILKNLEDQNVLLEEQKSAIHFLENKYKLGKYTSLIEEVKLLHARISEDVLIMLKELNSDDFTVLKKLKSLATEIHALLTKSLENISDLTLLELENVVSKINGKKEYFQLYANHYKDIVTINNSVFKLIQTHPITLEKLQKILAEVTLQHYFSEHFAHKRFNMDLLHHTIKNIALIHEKLLEINGEYIVEKQKSSFQEQIRKSELSLSGLNEKEREFKKRITEGRKILENEFGKSMRYKSIRDLSTLDSGKIIREIKPVWLMSPLSVSDTLPLDNEFFDVVIFDEASQITLEEGLPPIYRSKQSIIVGDEMQMPPSNFFGSSANNKDDLWLDDESEDDNFSLDADSFLTQGARKFPSIMLGWHYRSKHEALIGFSNASFYQNQLLTIPDVKDHEGEFGDLIIENAQDADNNVEHILNKPISYHYIAKGVYSNRTNVSEANYIAQLIRKLILENKEYSIGVVAFSMEQQNEIETAIQNICIDDKIFENLLEEEYKRIENNQFVGLFIKNLENVQGDERDIIIMSTCYGYDPRGKMLMNFGPINKRGGEKRLNVIFSRAKKSMCVVSSIKYTDIKNEYNDGANYFRKYLHYAELISKGNTVAANNVLNSIVNHSKPVISETLAAMKNEIEKLGYCVHLNIGQSNFKCSLAIKKNTSDKSYMLGIIVDEDEHYKNDDVIEQYLLKPNLLQYSGWNVCQVYLKDWVENKERVLNMIVSRLNNETFFKEPSIELFTVHQDPDVLQKDASDQPEEKIFNESTVAEHNCIRLTNTENESSKFWEVYCSEKDLVINYGRIGSKGKKLIKTMDTEQKALNEMAKLIAQKKSRGYQ